MANVRKIIAVALAGVIVLTGVLWLLGGLWLRTYGLDHIRKLLKQKFNVDVVVGGASTDLFNSLTLTDVALDRPFPVKLSRATLSLNPWNFLFPKPDRKVITVSFKDFRVDLPYDLVNPQTKKVDIPRITLPKFPILVSIENGTVSAKKNDVPVQITNLRGEIVSTPFNLKAGLHAEQNELGPLEAELNFDPAADGHWTANGKLPNVPLPDALSLVEDGTEALKTLRGKFDVDLKAEGKLYSPNPKASVKWDVEGRSKQLKMVPFSGQGGVPLNIKFQLNPKRLTIPSAQIGGALNVSGLATDPFGAPLLDLALSGNQFQLADLVSLLSDHVGLPRVKGTANVDIKVTGPPGRPSVRGTFQVNPVYGKAVFPPIKGAIDATPEKLGSNATWAGGEIFISRRGPFRSSYSVSVASLSISQLATAAGWTNVKGDFSSELTFDPSKQNFNLDGSFGISRLSWGRNRARDFTAGKISMEGNMLSMTTSDDSLTARALLKNDRFALETFRLDFGNQSIISAMGKADLESRSIAFNISGQNLPPDIYPPLVFRYPAMDGSLNFKGDVGGTFEAPDFNVDLEFESLRFLKNSNPWKGKTKLEWNRAEFKLNDVHVEGGYSGELTWRPEKPGGVWIADLRMNQADPQLIADVFRSTVDVNGTLSGQSRLRYQQGGFFGVSTVTWTNVAIGTFTLDKISLVTSMEGNKILIDDIGLYDGIRALRGNGQLEPVKNGWTYEFFSQIQNWGNQSFGVGGELDAEGSFSSDFDSFSADVFSSTLWVNEYPLEDFGVKIKRKGDRLTIAGAAAPQLKFDATMSLRRQTLTGDVRVKTPALRDTIKKLFPNLDETLVPNGEGSADVTVKGTLDDPLLLTKVSLQNGSWRNESMDASAFLEITKATASIRESRFNLKRGGVILSSGTIGLTGPKIVDIQGEGEAFSLEAVFNLLNRPLKWEGQANASFFISGGSTHRKMEILFEGTHEGFGPFKSPGDLAGEIHWENDVWDLSSVKIGTGNGYLQLLKGSEIFIDRDGAGRMRMVCDTRNIEAGLLTFFGQLEMTGSWSGRRLADENKQGLELDIFARSLYINQLILDGNITHLRVKQGELQFSPVVGSDQQISGVLDYRQFPTLKVDDFHFFDKNVERVYLNGLVGADKWDFVLNLKDVDADIIGGVFDTTIPMSGRIEAKIKGKGSLSDPRITADVVWRDGKFSILPLDLASCYLEIKDDFLSVDKISAVKKNGYQMEGKFTAPLNNEDSKHRVTEMNLSVTEGDLSVLKEIFPGVTKSKGIFEGQVSIGRSKGGHTIAGYFKAQKIALKTSTYIPSLDKGDLRFRFKDNKLLIEEAQALIGRGTVELTGYVDFEGDLPKKYDLALNTISDKGVSIRIPELTIPAGGFKLLNKKLSGFSRGEPKIDLTLKGDAEQPTLTGKIKLEDTVFTYPPYKAPSSKENLQTEQSSQVSRWFAAFKEKVIWDLEIVAGDGVWYQNESIDARVNGNIKFKGPFSDMDISGDIRTEQGAIVYFGNEFKIVRAEIEIIPNNSLMFQGKGATLVYLSAIAEKEVYHTDALGNSTQDTIIMTVDRSLFGEIQPRFQSRNNPSLPSERAAQLALGFEFTGSLESNSLLAQPRQSRSQEDIDKQMRVGLVGLLDSSLASPLARALARQTGLVDFIRVSYQERDPLDEPVRADNVGTIGTSNNVTQNQFLRYVKGTKVKLGRELSHRLFADYSFRVDEYQNQLDLRHEVELVYHLKRNVFLRAISELDSERTLGRPPDRRALVENQWRFGLPRKKKGAEADAKPVVSPSPEAPKKIRP